MAPAHTALHRLSVLAAEAFDWLRRAVGSCGHERYSRYELAVRPDAELSAFFCRILPMSRTRGSFVLSFFCQPAILLRLSSRC